MKRIALIGVVLFCTSAALAQTDRFGRAPRVDGIVFSADGKRMMAGFYVSPINEPGTDWDAWVTQWDLDKGTRKVIRGACWPASFGDGDKVSMGYFERGPRPTGLRPREAQWKFGQDKPVEVRKEIPFKEEKNEAAVYSRDRTKSATVKNNKVDVYDSTRETHRQFLAASGAVAFTPDGKILAVGDSIGLIRFWDVASGKLLRTLRSEGEEANTVHVAAVQFHSEFGNSERNRRELISSVEAAAISGAQIVVLPEASIPGYMSDDIKQTWKSPDGKISHDLAGVDVKKVAETVPGESTREFSALADKLGVYVTLPLIEVDAKTQKFFNSVVVFDPNGQIAIHYRKKNPWPWAECGWASDGNLANPIIDTPWGRLGTLVCFDIHNEAKIMGGQKVDMLLYCIAWVEDAESDWFAKKLPAVAKQNKFAIIGANWSIPDDAKPKWSGFGHTEIIDSDGKIRAKAKNDAGDELVFADLPVHSE